MLRRAHPHWSLCRRFLLQNEKPPDCIYELVAGRRPFIERESGLSRPACTNHGLSRVSNSQTRRAAVALCRMVCSRETSNQEANQMSRPLLMWGSPRLGRPTWCCAGFSVLTPKHAKCRATRFVIFHTACDHRLAPSCLRRNWNLSGSPSRRSHWSEYLIILSKSKSKVL